MNVYRKQDSYMESEQDIFSLKFLRKFSILHQTDRLFNKSISLGVLTMNSLRNDARNGSILWQ